MSGQDGDADAGLVMEALLAGDAVEVCQVLDGLVGGWVRGKAVGLDPIGRFWLVVVRTFPVRVGVAVISFAVIWVFGLSL